MAGAAQVIQLLLSNLKGNTRFPAEKVEEESLLENHPGVQRRATLTLVENLQGVDIQFLDLRKIHKQLTQVKNRVNDGIDVETLLPPGAHKYF